MAASSGPLWLLIFAAALYSRVAHGFEWEASSPQDGATIKACTSDRISFPWKFSVAVEERMMYAEWHKETDGIYQILATNVAGFFMKFPTANFSIDFLPNAGIQMSNFTREDYGNYRVSVIYKVNGTLYSESSSVVLELPDTPVLENNRLSAHIQPEPVTDVSTRERHVQLTCGTFLTLGNRPLIVEWRTPSGTIVPSSSYSNGTFYLTLLNPVVGGTYVCRLKDPSLVAGCMINNLNALRQGDYVLVDAVQTRLMLLEGSVQDLHAKDSSVDADLDLQEDVGNNLTSAGERLTSRVDDLQQQFVEQKKVDVNQNSDIILLNGELAKQKEVDAALTSNVTEFQDEDNILDIIISKTNAQRQSLKKKYKDKYKKELADDLKSELSGDFEEVMLGLLMPPVEYDAYCLHSAVQGVGTNEDVLIGIMCTANPKELSAVKEQYKKAYGKELDNALKGDTSGGFTDLLTALSQGQRDQGTSVNEKEAKEDAKALYNGGKGLDINDQKFKDLMTKKNKAQFQATDKEYKKLSGITLQEAIKKASSGDTEDGYVGLLCAMDDPVTFYADSLEKAFKGMGTNDLQLTRIVVSRSEVDLPAIKTKFQEKHGRSLRTAIEGETSGDYRKALLKLVDKK